jgi:TM2 domain-containing membrane protein YozV
MFAQFSELNVVMHDLELQGKFTNNSIDRFNQNLKNELYRTQACRVIAGSELDRIFARNDLRKANCTSVECLSNIGRLAAAPIVVSGSVISIQNKYYLNILVINVDDYKILASEKINGPLGEFETDAGLKTAKIINSVIEQHYAKIKVSITSNPSDAAVTLNGNPVGATPLEIPDLRQGIVYQIAIEKDGFTSHKESFQPSDHKNIINIVMIPKKGELSITGWPPKSKVFINNTYVGKFPYLSYQGAQGECSILIKKYGYKNYKQKIYIPSESTKSLHIILTEKPKIPAMFCSAIFPGSGQVYRGHPFRGFLLLATTAGVGYVAFQQYLVYDNQYQIYQRDLDKFNHQADLSRIERDRNQVWTSFNLMKEEEKKCNEILYVLGAVWTINVLEIVIE